MDGTWLTTVIIRPLAERLGTVTGTLVMSWGVTQDLSTAIGAGVAAIIIVGVELAVRHYRRVKEGKE